MSFQNREEWNSCFLWSTGILVFIALMYFIFGSSEPQPWSMPSLPLPHGATQDVRSQLDIPMKLVK